jgi:hypothetical protein
MTGSLTSCNCHLLQSSWFLCRIQECGQMTLDGVSSIFNCKALEDVLLRHTVIAKLWKTVVDCGVTNDH